MTVYTLTDLQRAKLLWHELEKNALGGYSGINRSLWIAEQFRQVREDERRKINVEENDAPNT